MTWLSSRFFYCEMLTISNCFENDEFGESRRIIVLFLAKRGITLFFYKLKSSQTVFSKMRNCTIIYKLKNSAFFLENEDQHNHLQTEKFALGLRENYQLSEQCYRIKMKAVSAYKAYCALMTQKIRAD